jgi:radical SAM superfamily enzyme YgiQ (UPF0313 family)
MGMYPGKVSTVWANSCNGHSERAWENMERRRFSGAPVNVLLVNPESPVSFWSLEGVLDLLGKKAVNPPLGLLTVAALLPQIWEYRLIDLSFQSLKQEDWDFADVVMVTGMYVQSKGIAETIKEAKRRGKFVVLGGAWAFHNGEEGLRLGADIVVPGEAEVVVSRLVEGIEGRESGNILVGETHADMGASPVPRFDLLEMDAYLDMVVQVSRGCPFKCEFCDVTTMLGHGIRSKAPAQFLAELQKLYDFGWRRHVFIVDDNFIGHRRKSKAVLKELVSWQKERGYPFTFTTQASVDLAADEELLDLLIQAAVFKVFLGIETTDEESHKLAGKLQNVTDLDHVCRTINRKGLQIIAGCILGFDNEKAGAGQRIVDFAVHNSIPDVLAYPLQAIPGTALARRLEQSGRLLGNAFAGENFLNSYGLMNFVPTRSRKEIAEELIELHEELYSPAAYIKRSFSHFNNMEPLPYSRPPSLPYFFELKAVITVIIRQGLLRPSLFVFWKHFLRALVSFPSHVDQFLASLILGEHLFKFAGVYVERLRMQIEEESTSARHSLPEETVRL